MSRISLLGKTINLKNKLLQLAMLIISFIILIMMPLINVSDYLLNIIIRFFIMFGIVASWNILSGYTRYINFGQITFYGLSAYICSIAIKYINLPVWSAILLGIFASILLGIIIGGVSLRLSGPHFTITTLITLFVVSTIFSNLQDFIEGATSEIWLPPVLVGSARMFVFYYIFFGIFAFTSLLIYWLEKTKFGLMLKAIGNDENEAMKLGINTTIEKLKAFLIGSAMAGTIGALHALYLSYVDVPVVLAPIATFLVVYIAIMGGAGIWFGPLLGALIYVPVDELLTVMTANPLYSRLLYGLLFVIIMFFIPDGIGGYIYKRVKFRGE